MEAKARAETRSRGKLRLRAAPRHKTPTPKAEDRRYRPETLEGGCRLVHLSRSSGRSFFNVVTVAGKDYEISGGAVGRAGLAAHQVRGEAYDARRVQKPSRR